MHCYNPFNRIETEEYEIPINLYIEGVVDNDKDKSSYNSLKNKPTLNGQTLVGDMTNVDLGIPTKASDLIDDGKYLTEQEQADWNENDTSSPAYIKNRPFYIDDRTEGESILSGNYTIQHFTEIGLGYKASTDILLEAYKKYKIVWDGKTYYMTALPNGGTRVVVGDIEKEPYFRIETYQTLENEKFIIIDYPSDVDAVHSISLSTLISQPVATQFFKDMVNNANIKETVVINAGSLSGKSNIENVRNAIIENYRNNKRVIVECSNLEVMVVRGTTNARSDTLDSVKFDDVSYDESTQIIEMKAIASKNFARYYVVTSIYPNIQVGSLVYMFSYNEIPTPDYRNGTYKLVATTDKFIPSYSWVSTSSDEDIMSRLESIEARLTALEG